MTQCQQRGTRAAEEPLCLLHNVMLSSSVSSCLVQSYLRKTCDVLQGKELSRKECLLETGLLVGQTAGHGNHISGLSRVYTAGLVSVLLDQKADEMAQVPERRFEGLHRQRGTSGPPTVPSTTASREQGEVVRGGVFFPGGGSGVGEGFFIRSWSHWGTHLCDQDLRDTTVCVFFGKTKSSQQAEPNLGHHLIMDWDHFEHGLISKKCLREEARCVISFPKAGKYLTSLSSTSGILTQKVEWVSDSPNEANTGPASGPGFSFN